MALTVLYVPDLIHCEEEERYGQPSVHQHHKALAEPFNQTITPTPFSKTLSPNYLPTRSPQTVRPTPLVHPSPPLSNEHGIYKTSRLGFQVKVLETF